MSATYSTNLALELIGTGDQAGNWGATNNLNIGTLLEQAISGYVTQAVSTGATTTLAMSQGASATARNMFIELTGSGGTNTNLVVPANKKLYFIYNNTSSGQVTVKVSGQTGVSVLLQTKVLLVCDGTDVVPATNYMASLSLGAPLSASSGGTGAATLTGVAYGNGTGAFTAATAAQIVSAISTTPVANANAIANTGGWAVTPSASTLYFSYAGTNIASLDSSGNLTVVGNVTAYGTL